MKRLIYLVAASCALLFLVSCQGSPSSTGGVNAIADLDQENEVAMIMEVIEKETSCFFARDYDCWKETWVNEDYAFQAWSNSDGTYDAKVGWHEVDRRIGNYIKDHPLEEGGSFVHPDVERLNLRTKFYGDKVAYLTWEQYNSNQEETSYQISQEVRLMEKVDGEWKIVTVAAFWDYLNPVGAGTFTQVDSYPFKAQWVKTQ